MTDIIANARQLAELKVPPLRAEITVHEDEDPRHTDDCLVQIIEKDDEYSIWYEEEHGGYKHGKLHFAHVFAAAPELVQVLAEETWEYTQEIYFNGKWQPIYEDLWFETQEECDDLWIGIEPWKYHDEPLRIVGRRVSKPEVISE